MLGSWPTPRASLHPQKPSRTWPEVTSSLQPPCGHVLKERHGGPWSGLQAYHISEHLLDATGSAHCTKGPWYDHAHFKTHTALILKLSFLISITFFRGFRHDDKIKHHIYSTSDFSKMLTGVVVLSFGIPDSFLFCSLHSSVFPRSLL